MRHAGAKLRHRGLRGGGKESLEVFVLGLRLREARDSPFVVIRVGDGELGFGKEFAVGIGVEQRLERQAANVETAVIDLIDRALVKNLVGLVTGVEGAR